MVHTIRCSKCYSVYERIEDDPPDKNEYCKVAGLCKKCLKKENKKLKKFRSW